MGDLSDRAHAELLMLCKNAVDDIDRTKREQWSQFYAIILAQAGATAFSRGGFVRPDHFESAQFVWIVLVVLMLLGLLVIGMHQLRLWRLRRLLERYSERLEEHSKDLLKKMEAKSLHRFLAPFLMVLLDLGAFFFFTW